MLVCGRWDPERPAQSRRKGNVQTMKIGFTEIILIIIVAFVVIGPDKLPEYARKAGKMLSELRQYTGAASKEIKENIVEPLDELQQPLKEAMAPLTDIKKDLDDSVKDVTKSFAGIGKTSKAKAEAAAEEPVEELEEVEELAETPQPETAPAEKAPAEEQAAPAAEAAPAAQAEPAAEPVAAEPAEPAPAAQA